MWIPGGMQGHRSKTRVITKTSFKEYIFLGVGKRSGSVKMNGNWLKNDNTNATMAAKNNGSQVV